MEREIAPLLAGAKVSTKALPGAITVRLEDGGDSVRVFIGSAVQEVADPGRRCDERARAAAVLIALALQPPALDAPPAKAEGAPVPGVPPIKTVNLIVDLATQGDLAPLSPAGETVIAAGGSLHLSIGRSWIGGVIGIAALAPSDIPVSTGTARVVRVPVDIDLRLSLRRGPFELAGDVGAVLTIVVVDGQGLPKNEHALGTEFGIRAAATVRWWFRDRIAPFLGVGLIGVPRPIELTVAPVGIVGTTPRIWLDLALGLAVRLR